MLGNVYWRNIRSFKYPSVRYCKFNYKKRTRLSSSIKQDASSSTRINYANIQMISPGLHNQIFQDVAEAYCDDVDILHKTKEHLTAHDLWGKPSSVTENVDFEIPDLTGSNIAEHFKNIASTQCSEYFNKAEHMANALTKIPCKPRNWQFCCGWTKYNPDGTYESVVAPDENVLVFDVEICLSFGKAPILATAVSKSAWYCWVSPILLENETKVADTTLTPEHMIPMKASNQKKLLIGHHVSFDRGYVKEQYELKDDGTRFLDTLSLHMCVSGVTTEQRNYMNTKDPVVYDWMEFGSTNSLAKIYEFYCNESLDKSTRDYFIEGTLDDIRENFQECVQYCAMDVTATQNVFEILWPMFLHHAPHPVTFSGMLEMGSAYLPINETWSTYIQEAEDMYTAIQNKMKKSLMAIADDVLELLINERYKEDPWLWNLDWSLHKSVTSNENYIAKMYDAWMYKGDLHTFIEDSIEFLSEKRRQQLHLAGYPKWYRDLCMRPNQPNYKPGPVNISSQTKITPSILRMTWDGYPLHHERKHGWGYLAPEKDVKYLEEKNEEMTKEKRFPLKNYLEVIKQREIDKQNEETDIDIGAEIFQDEVKKEKAINIGLPGVVFYKLPHKDGSAFNVGNPLAKDYLIKIEDGTLASTGSFNAKQPIQMNKMLAFWRNGRRRIRSQMTVWIDDEKSSSNGVILPQVITAGTVTRRAVEPTWLTASNPLPDRIGSELKSMIRSPPGYCFVGADVDSQELWIASLLGDAQFAQIHGSTALSWMTLQGQKLDRTDLHSKTADTIGISREQAKIFNYGRVYGAGEKFAVRLLMQFNHMLTFPQAERTAAKLYEATKGIRMFKLTSKGREIAEELDIPTSSNGVISYNSLKRILYETGLTWETRDDVVEIRKAWHGGSESEMFNKLEEIALCDEPRTPVLGCMITNALLPKYVHAHYKTSRVNWVVQSSAVDYLHLMLTCMKWLITKYQIDARFCISIHDEVRYIVSENDKYRAALALQITNLLTRSMFAYKLGMFDLPQCVAFFSAVDIDKVLRKEVDMDCVTPSNPDGLQKRHAIPPGESLDIYQLLKKTNNGKLET